MPSAFSRSGCVRACRPIGLALVLGIATSAGTGGAAYTSATAPPAAVSGDAAGHAIVDTETSSRREAEFERTPYLPQVFAHQWVYRGPEVATPTVDGDDGETARLTVAEAVHQALLHNPSVAAQRLT